MVACDIKTELVAVMVKARDRYPCDDPAARLAAWATMFRCWALVNRAEFQMALANPTLAAASLSSRRDGLGSLPEVNEDGSLNPFAAYFAQLFINLHSQGLIAVPRPEDLDPGLRALIQESAKKRADSFVAALGVGGIGTRWVVQARLGAVIRDRDDRSLRPVRVPTHRLRFGLQHADP